jgi:hypothetical protein
MNLILVNRSNTAVQKTNIKINDFIVNQNSTNRLIIKNLSNSETFYSDSKNAKSFSQASIFNNELNIDLEPLSVSSITLSGVIGAFEQKILAIEPAPQTDIQVYPNPSQNKFKLKNIESEIVNMSLATINGSLLVANISIDTDFGFSIPTNVGTGIYFLNITLKNKGQKSIKLIVK